MRALVVVEAIIWCICAFAVAALLLGPVSDALLTRSVLYHYLKTARMNPAETLKNE